MMLHVMICIITSHVVYICDGYKRTSLIDGDSIFGGRYYAITQHLLPHREALRFLFLDSDRLFVLGGSASLVMDMARTVRVDDVLSLDGL